MSRVTDVRARFCQSFRYFARGVAAIGLISGCARQAATTESCPAAIKPTTRPATQPATRPASQPAAVWKDLFDGKSLTGWRTADFAGHGEVEVKDDQLQINSGEGLTGLTYSGDLAKTNYEVEVVAKRVDGSDFFCGLTFPVGESHASLIVGGWGGAVVGISSVDDADAANNETTTYEKFEKNRWYKVRVRVTPTKVQAWIDDVPAVDLVTTGKKISLRTGIEESKPLGLSTWMTSSAIKSVKLRKLQ